MDRPIIVSLYTILLLPLQYTENKSFAEDLTEGKFGFPVIHAVRTQKQDKQVLRKSFDRTS